MKTLVALVAVVAVVAVVALVALVTVERQFIYAHKQKGSFRHVILPTKNGGFWEKGWLNVLHFVRNAVI